MSTDLCQIDRSYDVLLPIADNINIELSLYSMGALVREIE